MTLHSLGGGGQDFVDTIIAILYYTIIILLFLKGVSRDSIFSIFIKFYGLISVHSYVRWWFALKGECHDILSMNPSSPKPLKITLESFKICVKICGDIHKSRYTTGINNTCGKFATGVVDTNGKFATGINDTGGKLSHQYHWCCWYWWPICRGGQSTNCKSANLWTYKICYICGPSAIVANLRIANPIF